MKRLLIISLVLGLLTMVSCKSNKNDDEITTNPYTDNSFVSGDGFDFWGDMVNHGGIVTVTPAELMRLAVRFHQDFLESLSVELQIQINYVSLELRTSSDGSAVVSRTVPVWGTPAVDINILRYIVERPAATYYIAACAGGFGNKNCSSANKLTYTGEEGSIVLQNAPSNINHNNGCRFMNFNLNVYDPNQELFQGPFGLLNDIKVYRSTTSFSDPSQAQEVLDAVIYSGYQSGSAVWTFSAELSSWYTDGYIGLRVRDIDGRLSPMSQVVNCSQ